MSTKPSDVGRWASTGGASIVVPPSGKKDVGWVAGERPPSSYWNWLANTSYLWQQYLSDGNFQGASTFDNTLGITGATTVGGTLGVTGLVTATAGVTCGANTNVVLSGTGVYKRGTRTRWVHGNAGMLVGTGAFSYDATSGGLKSGATSNVFAYPILLQDDEQLTGVTVWFRCGNSDQGSFKMWSYDQFTVTKTQLGSTQTSSGGHIAETALTVSGLTATTGTTKTFYAEVTIPAFSTGFIVDQVSFTTTVP